MSEESTTYYETSTEGTVPNTARNNNRQKEIDEVLTRQSERAAPQTVVLKQGKQQPVSRTESIKGENLSPSSTEYSVSSTSSKKSILSKKSSASASQKKVQLSPPQKELNFNAEITKLFKSMDVNNNGTISKTELAVAIRAFGVEPSLKDINDLYAMSGSKDGALNLQQFASLMKKTISMKKFEDDTQQQKDIQEVFDEIDKDRDGFISFEEFKDGLEKHLPKSSIEPEKDNAIIREIMSHLDRNGDGFIDIDEFNEIMAKDSNFKAKCMSLFHPSPMDYIKLFKPLPTSFRPSVLHSVLKSGKNNTSKFVVPGLNESGINFVDLTIDSFSKTILPIYAHTMKINILNAKGVPLPREAVKIVERKAYLVLCADDQYISNVYQIGATWSPNKLDEWVFGNDVETSLVIRTVNDNVNTNLLMELVAVVELDNGKVHEVCCGHTTIPIINGDYLTTKAYDFYLMGGSIHKPVDIPQEEILINTGSMASKLGMIIKGIPRSQISARMVLVSHPKEQHRFCQCPPNIITNIDSFEILALYRKMLAKALFPTRVLDERMAPSMNLSLRWFPNLLDDRDLWLSFVERWKILLVKQSREDKKAKEHLLTQLVRDAYGALFCKNLPKYNRQPTSNGFYDNPRDALNYNANFIHKPFDAREMVLQPIVVNKNH